MKSLPSGSSVTNFSVATNRVWKDADGQKQEQVEYHNIVAFGKTAENIAKYFSKGQQIYVRGRLQTRSWDGDDGKKNYRTEIILTEFQFGNNPNNNSSQDSGYSQSRTSYKSTKQSAGVTGSEYDAIAYGDDDINPDDIPF
jgi:single-strand DNA-binding protein